MTKQWSCSGRSLLLSTVSRKALPRTRGADDGKSISLLSLQVTLLKLDNSQMSTGKDTADATALIGVAAGTCFDFNPSQPHIFLVGTVEGRIFKCSKNYSGQYLHTYEGTMPTRLLAHSPAKRHLAFHRRDALYLPKKGPLYQQKHGEGNVWHPYRRDDTSLSLCSAPRVSTGTFVHQHTVTSCAWMLVFGKR